LRSLDTPRGLGITSERKRQAKSMELVTDPVLEDGTPLSGRSRYDWDAWIKASVDGDTWIKLMHGTDVPESTQMVNFRIQLYEVAKRKGIGVETRLPDSHTLYVRFSRLPSSDNARDE